MDFLLVGFGGFIGSISRYGLGKMVQHMTVGSFPYGTLLVNVVGCLIIGVFSGLLEKGHQNENFIRLFLMVGLLGGFTTFSAFGLETFALWRNGNFGLSMLNISANIVLGLSAVVVGRFLIFALR